MVSVLVKDAFKKTFFGKCFLEEADENRIQISYPPPACLVGRIVNFQYSEGSVEYDTFAIDKEMYLVLGDGHATKLVAPPIVLNRDQVSIAFARTQEGLLPVMFRAPPSVEATPNLVAKLMQEVEVGATPPRFSLSPVLQDVTVTYRFLCHSPRGSEFV